MKWNDVRNMLDDGQIITVKFTDMIEKIDIDEAPDKDMIAKILRVEVDHDDEQSLHLVFDVPGYEDYNRKVASHNWFDENGQPTLTWFDTKWYPKDGICDVYVFGTMETEVDLFTILPGCECCYGDEALFYQDDQNNAFIDSTGEMLVTAKDHIIRFKVNRCPRCGFVFGSE